MTKPSLPRELQGIPGVVLERKHDRWGAAVVAMTGFLVSGNHCSKNYRFL